MGVAGPIFKPHPPNFVWNHFSKSCKNAEIFVRLPKIVYDLAKISVSVPSIYWGVLGEVYGYDVNYSKKIKIHGAF